MLRTNDGKVYFTEEERQKYEKLSVKTLEMLIRSHIFKGYIIRAGKIIGAER